MKKQPERITITAALPYTNGPIHIGHLAGVYIPADIYSRYQKAKGNDAIYICGSDEHGVPITIRAKKEGITPQQVVDKYHRIIKESFEKFGIAFDHYSRTSLPVHHRTASDFFKTLYDKGVFIEQTSRQLYDEAEEQFLADRFVTGTCPKCGYEHAYGDQCEKCGSSLSPMELINPVSAISGNKPVVRETKHWYLPLDQYETWLREWILEGHAGDWKTNVLGQVKSWLDDGLRPRAVTRDLDWGVPVPVEGATGKVLYVWFDAPIGYISSTKEWAEKTGKDWKPYWKDPDTKLIHFIGKDNIVFHTIIFPAMLKAEGSYILPENVPANEFLNLEGNKISTSRNWAVWLHEYLEDFPGKQDVLRYVLTANAPETKDNDFTWKDFQAKNNNELVAIFGNFINRVAVLLHKYYQGAVPVPARHFEVLSKIAGTRDKIGAAIEQFKFREALKHFMDLSRAGNVFLQEQEPWKKIKTNPGEVKDILYAAVQIAAALGYLSEPFLPFTSEKIKKMLNLPPKEWDAVEAEKDAPLIPPGRHLEKPVLLFDKIEDTDIERQIQKLLDTKKENSNTSSGVTEIKPEIDFGDFSKLDIRTGTIIEAGKMPKTDKLMVLKVDTGIDIRTVVSGIAAHYTPGELPGKKVLVLVNLKPKKIRGVMSHGMILMVETPDGKLLFVNPEGEIPGGMQVS